MAHGRLLYIGTYTKGSSKGVYAAHFNPDTGEMTAPKLVAETPNPTFLALSPDRRYLYAVNEVENYKGTHDGSLVSYKTDRSGGQLTEVNVVDSNGSGPCHLQWIRPATRSSRQTTAAGVPRPTTSTTTAG